MFSIFENLMLISIDDSKGKMARYTSILIRYGLAGAVLFELASCEFILIENNKMYLNENGKPRNFVLESALSNLNKSGKPKKINSWIFNNSTLIRNVRKGILKSFVDKGIVREEEKRILGLFPVKRYPVTNILEKQKIISEIRNILLDDKTPNDEYAMLVSLIVVCRAVNCFLTSGERKEIKDKIKKIAKSEYFKVENESTAKIIKAVKYAIAAQAALSSI